MELSDGRVRILYDAKLTRPGCVLLAALAGTERAVLHRMDNWLLAPTPDMKVYEVTAAELEALVTITNRAP